MKEKRTTVPDAQRALLELRGNLHGTMITPDDTRYSDARKVFYGWIDRHPAAIIRVANDSDISRVVSVTRECGLQLAVRSGGHSVAGHSMIEGGIVLDLSEMKNIQFDVPERTAWAQAGLTAGEYTKAAAAHGLATGFGDSGTVGIGGITLGGGVGFLVRKFGMTIDSLLAADIVTADGKLLHVSAKEHPDLFWAIRGGGGNFGVVTRFNFRLQEVDQIVGGILMLPATAEMIQKFIAEAEAAPEELSAIANIMLAPPMPFVPKEHHGKLMIMAMMVHAGSVDAGQRAVAPFRALATPAVDMVRPMRYQEMFEMEGPHPTAVAARSCFVDSVTQQMAESIVGHIGKSTASMAVVQLRVLGGAMARVPVDASAFAHRKKRIMANVAALYERVEEAAAHEDWVARCAETLHRGDKSVYVNFLGDEGPDRVRDAYPGPTLDRLAKIKSRYDPTNFFSHLHNVPPSR